MKTRTGSRIRIREGSGRIRGPYMRQDICDLIRKKKLSGEEEIFLESEGKWKPIGSDTEFFDLIQEVFFGIQPGTRTTVPTKIERSDRWTDSFEKDPYPKADATEKLGTQVRNVQSPITKTIRQSEQQNTNIPGKKPVVTTPVEPITPPRGEFNTSTSAQPQIQGFDDIKSDSKVDRSALRRKALTIVAIVLVGFVILKNYKPSNSIDESSATFDFTQLHYDIQFNKGYFRPLGLRMKLFSPVSAPPPKLKNDIALVKYLPLNVHDGMLRWAEIEKNKDWSVSAAAWMEKAWILRIMGDTVAASNLDQGRQLSRAAEFIVADLVRKGAIEKNFQELYGALNLALGGKILEALQKISVLNGSAAKGVQREISYWASFDTSSDFTSSSVSDDEGFDFPDKIQKEEALRRSVNPSTFDQDFLKKAEAVLRLDSHSLISWFLLGRYYGKAFKSSPQIANRYYISGLAVLSLYPRFLQGLYWRSYAQFVSQNGLGETPRYVENAELLENGRFDTSVNALDIDSEAFKLEFILQTYRKAFEQNEMNPIELASFEVLSELSKNPKENLFQVLMMPLLDRDFPLIEARLRLLEKTFPYDYDIKTLRVWFEGEKFRFDVAEEILRKEFQGAPNKAASAVLRAEGIYFILGFDYENGIKRLFDYLQKETRDALTYFFLARGHIGIENYTECVRFASLAKLNSTGPLRLRSQIMTLRCRVKARLSVDEALKELAQLVSKFSQTSISREEYVRALLDADRSEEAVKIAETAVRENPLNSSLKVLLGEVYEKRAMNNEALALYNEARRQDPSQARSAVRIGDLFFKEKRYVEAAQNYIAAGAQSDETPEVFLKAARAYRKAGKNAQAEEMYFKEVKLRPAVLETFLEAGEFFLEKGHANLVPQLFKLFSENFQSDPRVLTRLAQAYNAMGDPQNARINAELAVRQNPKEPEPYRILGSVFENAGQYPLAKANFEKYLILLPQAPDAKELKQKLSNPPFSL